MDRDHNTIFGAFLPLLEAPANAFQNVEAAYMDSIIGPARKIADGMNELARPVADMFTAIERHLTPFVDNMNALAGMLPAATAPVATQPTWANLLIAPTPIITDVYDQTNAECTYGDVTHPPSAEEQAIKEVEAQFTISMDDVLQEARRFLDLLNDNDDVIGLWESDI